MFHVRHGKPEDLDFVVKTMVSSLAPRYKPMKSDRYWPWMKKLVNGLLERSMLLTAVADDDEDTILGFAVFSGDCLHFVYARPEGRQLGAPEALFKYVAHVKAYSIKGGLKATQGLEYRPDLGL